jgi:arylsulfotransferase ASST
MAKDAKHLYGLAGYRKWEISAGHKLLKAEWHKIYLVLSLCMIAFFYGVAVEQYRLFPYQVLRDAKESAKDWLADTNYLHYLRIRPEKFLRPARQAGSGVTIYVKNKAYSGVTFLTSMWEKTNGMELIAMDGTVLHAWSVSLNKIWPTPNSGREKQFPDWGSLIHGALLYPNGDIVFNFEYEGLAKIDRCSRVVWKVPFVTHHSVYEDGDGNLWVPGRKVLAQSEKRLPLLEPPIHEDYILKISHDGRILEQISMLDVIYQSGQESLLFANGSTPIKMSGNDVLHMNDVKILEKSIAGKFPLFQAGDIMVSMRNLNLIVVIDHSTKKIKWSMTGPYFRQHDPQFLPNGHISVYDNHEDLTDGKIFGGSRILSIDPVTRKVDVLYQGDARNSFFSNMRGKHQYLPNGNILVTEDEAGRVFEITSSGEVVWSYINRYDEDEVYIVTGAKRYPSYYTKFTQEMPPCQGDPHNRSSS